MKLRYIGAALLGLLWIVYPACRETKSIFYGRQVIEMPSGKEIYIKTMVWGITSDHQITVISATKDLYDFRNAKDDYQFPFYLPALYYKTGPDSLTLYVTSKAGPPESGQFPIKVDQVEVDILDYQELKAHPEKLGASRLEITTDTNLDESS
jgi:hypothetical protein